jgi:nitroreductase
MTTPVPFEDFTRLVHERRTSMVVDQNRAVDPDLVAELCGLATWAPNHKKTWPWRFALFTGDGRARLGATMVDDMAAASFGDDGKRIKTATKYTRTPAVLVVAAASHENEMLDAENRDAVAAGVQNLLLGATALGLASFWSTPALTRPPGVLRLCGFEPTDRVVAVIYLGWSVGTAAVPDRPAVTLHHVSD